MYTISNVMEDIGRGCMIHNLNEDCFSYRIIYFVNENGVGTKHYIDTTYSGLRKALENIIRNNISMTNKIAIANVTILKGGNSICLLSRSYAFSLDEYFWQIVGKREKENKTVNYYGRRRLNWW